MKSSKRPISMAKIAIHFCKKLKDVFKSAIGPNIPIPGPELVKEAIVKEKEERASLPVKINSKVINNAESR